MQPFISAWGRSSVVGGQQRLVYLVAVTNPLPKKELNIAERGMASLPGNL
jgi:hypothetical protein